MTHFHQLISARIDGNMAFNTKHSPLAAVSNREAFAAEHSFSLDQVVGIQQAHTDNIQIVTTADAGKGAREWRTAFPATDGLLTNENDLILLVLGADCSLISFFDPVCSVVGLAHSGWQGTTKEISSKMIQLMCSTFGCNPRNIVVSLSPSAGACCYEVGTDIASQFLKWNDVLANHNGKTYLDVKRAVIRQCLAQGVPEKNIELSPICTICSNDYFSFRREAELAGRFGLWAWQGMAE